MANEKISQMPDAATLDGSELVPLVQSGDNVKTTVSALTGISGSVFVQNFSGIAPVLTPVGQAIALDTSSGAGWGYDGTTWIRFF